MSQKIALTIAILVAAFFVTSNRAEPTADDSPPPMIRRPSNDVAFRMHSVGPQHVPSQIRSTRIHGTWQLHSSTQHLPEIDKWQLVIYPDGTAKYTGLLPSAIEEKRDADSEGFPGGIVTRLEIKERTINGQWDLSDQYFSIVTSDPAIHRFHVLAITPDTLVVEPDLGHGSSGILFWVRSPTAQ